jgi:hypothetical protein
MPDIGNAIPGQANHARVQQKARRLATENFSTLPDYLKTWTPEEARQWVLDNVDQTNYVQVISKIAEAIILFRDFMLLKQEN